MKWVSVVNSYLKMKYQRRLMLFLVVTLFKGVFSGLDNREFVLEKLVGCRGGPYSIQFNIKTANITKNRFVVDGDVVVSNQQSKDLQVLLKYRRCNMETKDSKCGGMVDYVLPKVCNLVTGTGVFGIKLDKMFDPQWECPLKASTYKLTVNLSLKQIVKIPLDKTRYETKMILQDAGKKKQLGCVEGVWWLKNI